MLQGQKKYDSFMIEISHLRSIRNFKEKYWNHYWSIDTYASNSKYRKKRDIFVLSYLLDRLQFQILFVLITGAECPEKWKKNYLFVYTWIQLTNYSYFLFCLNMEVGFFSFFQFIVISYFSVYWSISLYFKYLFKFWYDKAFPIEIWIFPRKNFYFYKEIIIK